MANIRWIVSVDGKQLEGDHSTDEVRTVIHNNPGKSVLVWGQGMAQWADPNTLPEFKKTSVAAAGPESTGKPAFAGKVSGEQIKQQAGILKGLFDFRFRHLITTKIIPILYILSLLLIILGGLAYFFIGGGGMIFQGIRLESFPMILTGLGIMVITPFAMLLYLAFIRTWFELLIVFHRMRDSLDTLVSHQEGKDK